MAENANEMNRREVTKLMGLAATGVGGVSLSGCMTGGDSGGDSQLTVIAGAPSTTLNPFFGEGVRASMFAIQWMYSGLTRFNSDLEVQPDLAVNWEAEDETTWMFELREGAYFSYNDQEVLAEDVKATFDTIYDPELEHPWAGLMGPIDSVEIVNDYAVQFNMSDPFTILPHKMGLRQAKIAPKHAIENKSAEGQPGHAGEFVDSDFGSGPFDLVEYEPNSQITFEATDDFYLSDDEGNDLPHVEEANIQIIQESYGKVNALENREADILPIAPPAQWERINGIDHVVSDEKPGGQAYPMVMDRTAEPFDELDFVHAVKYAIDKEEILQGVAGGLGTLAQDNIVCPSHLYYADLPNKFGPGAQPEEARSLLDDLGYPDEFEIDLVMAVPDHNQEQVDTAVLIQDQLSEVGINFEINQMTWDTYLSEWLDHPFYVTSYAFNPHPDDDLYTIWHPDGDWSYKDHLHEVTDEAWQAIESARAATNEEERREHYVRAQEVIQEQGGHVFPYFQSALAGYLESVQNYDPNPLQTSVPVQNSTIE